MATKSKDCSPKMGAMLSGKGKNNQTVMAGKPIKKPSGRKK